jgi:hypothetical protein
MKLETKLPPLVMARMVLLPAKLFIKGLGKVFAFGRQQSCLPKA